MKVMLCSRGPTRFIEQINTGMFLTWVHRIAIHPLLVDDFIDTKCDIMVIDFGELISKHTQRDIIQYFENNSESDIILDRADYDSLDSMDIDLNEFPWVYKTMEDYAMKFRTSPANHITIKSYHKWRGVIIPKSNITHIPDNITTVKAIKEFLTHYIEVLLSNTSIREYDINYKYSFVVNTYSNKFYTEILRMVREKQYELINLLINSIIIAGYFGCGYYRAYTESSNITELLGGRNEDKIQLGAIDFDPVFYHKHNFKLSKPMFSLHNNIKKCTNTKKLINLLNESYPGVTFILSSEKKTYPANYEHIDKGILEYSMLEGVASNRTKMSHKIEDHIINIFKTFKWVKSNITLFIMMVEHEYAHYIEYSSGNTFEADIYSDNCSDLLLEGEIYPLTREILAEIILTHAILDVDVMMKFTWDKLWELSSVARLINNASVKYDKQFRQQDILKTFIQELLYINNYI